MASIKSPAGAPASGRFLLRLDPALHAALREEAEARGLSLNGYCARKLATACEPLEGGLAEAVERSLAVFGEGLVGVVVYGSWARGEAAVGSDVDLLVVVESDLPITRELYRRWDGLPPQHIEGHRIEPHFVHLVEPEGRVTGTWAEAAVDGLVLYERDHKLSRRLAALRRRIADGEIERRWVHGQPYWVEAPA